MCIILTTQVLSQTFEDKYQQLVTSGDAVLLFSVKTQGFKLYAVDAGVQNLKTKLLLVALDFKNKVLNTINWAENPEKFNKILEKFQRNYLIPENYLNWIAQKIERSWRQIHIS